MNFDGKDYISILATIVTISKELNCKPELTQSDEPISFTIFYMMNCSQYCIDVFIKSMYLASVPLRCGKERLWDI